MDKPSNRPQWTREKIEEILTVQFAKANTKKPNVVLLGVRGYFEDSMGKVNQNDRGVYDDALFLISPEKFISFNFNTDPSRTGFNEHAGKGFAVLQPGIYQYQIGIHGLSKPKTKQYKALIQYGRVRVKRDNTDTVEVGFFGVNIHRGGVNTTSSEGCQTVVEEQWKEAFEAIEKEMEKYNQSTIPYCLIEQQG